MKNLFWFLVFCLFLIGCSNSSKTVDIPNWYQQSYQNNSQYLYGIGDSNSLDGAKNEALSMISGSIISIVNGETNIKKFSNNDVFIKENRSNVKVELAKINFQNPIIEKQEYKNETFYVLLKIDKKQLEKSVYDEFYNLDTKIDNQITIAHNVGELEQILVLYEVVGLSNQAISKLQILQSLDKTFDTQKYLNKYVEFSNKLQKLQSDVTFSIVSNDQKFEFEMTKYLNQYGFKISNQSQNQIILTNESKIFDSKGWKIAKSSTNIKILSNGKTLNSFDISSIGRSSSKEELAVSNSATVFFEELSKIGPKEFFSKKVDF